MGSSKHDKALSSTEVDQLMNAVQNLDKSIAYLSKLLQNSIAAQAKVDKSRENEVVLPRKTIH